MSFFAPVIGKIAGRIFDHANPNLAKVLCAPDVLATYSRMFGVWNRIPVGDAKGNIGNLHEPSRFEKSKKAAYDYRPPRLSVRIYENGTSRCAPTQSNFCRARLVSRPL